MTEQVADLLRKAMALPVDARVQLANSILSSLGGIYGDGEVGWILKHRERALSGLEKAGRPGFMEASFHLSGNPIRVGQPELVRSAERAAIHAFGWPIGIVLHNEGRPRAMADGIVAEVQGSLSSYDYWALRTNGDFYFLGDLFEDERAQNAMWFDTRIMRVTETFLFCYRLYKILGAPEETEVTISIRHGGLLGRVLSSARPAVWALNRTSQEAEVEWKGTVLLSSIRTQLHGTVKAALDPLFVLFDFFQPPQAQVYGEIDGFLKMVENQQQPFQP